MSRLRRLPASLEEELLDLAGFLRRQPSLRVFQVGAGLVAVKVGRPSQADHVGGLLAHSQWPGE